MRDFTVSDITVNIPRCWRCTAPAVGMYDCYSSNYVPGIEKDVRNITINLCEVDEHESVCFECAEAEALKAKEEKREIQITHGEFAEAWSLCQWCDSLFPKSELQ